MFVSLFAIDTERDQKVFRSTRDLSQSKITFYLTEFATQVKDGEGVIERETYNYAYTSSQGMFYCAQLDKNSFLSDAFTVLKFIKENADKEDIFDILLYIDNILYNGEQLIDNLSVIKNMDSQDEKIYNLMIENKKMEMEEKAKEYEKQSLNKKLMDQYKQNVMEEQKPVAKPISKKIEKSNQPILLILKEKLCIKIDKENFIKENSLAGELSMVISEAKYRNIQIKMVDFPSSCKFSPYLEKNFLKRNTLKFDKERQLNKNIPLLKWTGKVRELPLTLDCWVDEDEGRFCSTLTFNANRSISNLKIKLNHSDVTDVEIDGKKADLTSNFVLMHDKVKKGHGVTHEIKYAGFDSEGIFPMEISFEGETEGKLNLKEISLEGELIKDYEFRKLTEIEKYEIGTN